MEEDQDGVSSDQNDGDGQIDPYLDAADRLEQTVETQVSLINGIDDKAEHVTRLLAILLGLVFTVLSLVVNLEQVEFETATIPVQISFGLGILLLLLAMAAAIVTYLSSRFRVGLHQNVGKYLSQPDTKTDFDEHIRRVLGSYAKIIEENKEVINTNSKRFRISLLLLLVGMLFLSTSGTLFIGGVTGIAGWGGFALAVGLTALAAWYILGGRYLTLDAVESNNE